MPAQQQDTEVPLNLNETHSCEAAVRWIWLSADVCWLFIPQEGRRVTMQWIRDSVPAGKPMSLSRRVDTVLYRPLPYPLPVPAFRSQVCTVAECAVVVPVYAHGDSQKPCSGAR